MREVWKYPLEKRKDYQQVIPMPIGAQALSAVVRADEVVIYMLVDLKPAGGLEERTVYFYPTGVWMPVDEALQFVGTVLLYGGEIVGHVFISPSGA